MGSPVNADTDIICPQMQCKGKYTAPVPNILAKTIKLESNQVSRSISCLQEMSEMQKQVETLPPGRHQMNPKCEHFYRTTELVSSAK